MKVYYIIDVIIGIYIILIILVKKEMIIRLTY